MGRGTGIGMVANGCGAEVGEKGDGGMEVAV